MFQVEYAKEAVKRGSTALGIVFKDGVLLATVKPEGKLVVPTSVEKLFQIDDHIGTVSAGLLADARILIAQARVRAQVHKITYEEPIDVWTLARAIGDRMQLSTLYAGLRPFGVSLLIGGTDKEGGKLIEADPSGMLYEWQAYAIGQGAILANKIFEQKWRPGISLRDAVNLAMDVILKSEKKKHGKIVDIAVVRDGKFQKLSDEDLKKI